ncbi:hypothetical protein OS125_09770 [Corynebacterium sp. P7003]|uniref:Uncharacterized protein n=1 Tax=Corynebacterium pygosceleis TaxID=2800406 RepID=A0ABT3WTH9_9CORY|nr:hypothetical protein [Corynebacterium pygosceleis]MCX7445525.1 hypothetical protein [Corynebacterium pygosceleis]
MAAPTTRRLIVPLVTLVVILPTVVSPAPATTDPGFDHHPSIVTGRAVPAETSSPPDAVNVGADMPSESPAGVPTGQSSAPVTGATSALRTLAAGHSTTTDTVTPTTVSPPPTGEPVSSPAPETGAPGDGEGTGPTAPPVHDVTATTGGSATGRATATATPTPSSTVLPWWVLRFLPLGVLGIISETRPDAQSRSGMTVSAASTGPVARTTPAPAPPATGTPGRTAGRRSGADTADTIVGRRLADTGVVVRPVLFTALILMLVGATLLIRRRNGAVPDSYRPVR